MGFPEQQQQVPGVQSRMTPVPDCGEQSYRASGKPTGKSTVITGADSGIGRAVAIAATKAAIANFSASLAQLLGERGIRVNSVAPGPIWTPLIPATMPTGKVSAFGDDLPLGRAGQPAELAQTYVLLASDDGSYISGARIAVTGGRPIL